MWWFLWFLILWSLFFAGDASATGGHHDWCEGVRECVKPPESPCVSGYSWLWYAAKNRTCEPAAHDHSERAFLCYYDRYGVAHRWKFFGWVPMSEAVFEADLRNTSQCQ